VPDHCPYCEGWGVVAPHDPDDLIVAWADFLDSAVAEWLACGYPACASATLSGRIKPVPCPKCDGAKTRPWHQVMPFVQFADLGGNACGIERAALASVCRPAAAGEAEVAALVAAGLITPPKGVPPC